MFTFEYQTITHTFNCCILTCVEVAGSKSHFSSATAKTTFSNIAHKGGALFALLPTTTQVKPKLWSSTLADLASVNDSLTTSSPTLCLPARPSRKHL